MRARMATDNHRRPQTTTDNHPYPMRVLAEELRAMRDQGYALAETLAPYVATARVLTPERLVNRELLDVRRPLELGAGCGHRALNPRRERVEVLA